MPANIVLLIGSLLFCLYSDYTSGTYVSTLILSMVTIINYFITRLTDYYYGKERFIKLRTFLFVMTVVLDVALLVIYKIIIGRLPLGISFYTFTILAYVTDTYFRKTETETNFINMAAYITMFPRLVQGPISRYESFEKNMHKRHVSLRRFDKALKLFILGMSYKVLVADRLAGLFTELQKIGFESVSTPLAWLGAVSYSLQLYFDFAGYTLMAIGVGSMLGFRLPQNFDNPYASRSISEFYRRWHITLGAWFKDYIYIPLGGSRKGMLRTVINLFVVWLITGFWHGVTLNFIIWGLGLFVFIAMEKLVLQKWLDKSAVLSRIYVWFVISLSWVVFAIDDIKRLGVYFTRLFPFIPYDYISNVSNGDYLRYARLYAPFLIIAILLCIPRLHKFIMMSVRKWYSSVALAALFLLCLYYLAQGMDNPFMYFVF